MLDKSQRKARVLVLLGLLGLCGYQIAYQLGPSVFQANDLVKGLWVGGCLGIEIMGLICFKRRKLRLQ